jgi:hypothetical protein
VRRADALPDLGGGPTGLGGLLLYGFTTIVGLALLENALSGRGPAGAATVLNTLGGGIRKLVDPHDPLLAAGAVRSPSSSTASASSGAAAAVTAAPLRTGKVRFTGVSLAHTDRGFLARVIGAAQAAGATVIQVESATRTPGDNRAAGGVSQSNHLPDPRGFSHALDGKAFIPGRGWIPLGLLPTLGRFHLRSGNQPGFFRGGRDPGHIDDGFNVRR